MDCSPPGSSVHGDSPGKNNGGGCHALLQGIFPTRGSNPGLPHYRRILYHLSHQGSPRIPEWVPYPFFRGNFQTQESNQGLLNCRQILYQLSYPGSCKTPVPGQIQCRSAPSMPALLDGSCHETHLHVRNDPQLTLGSTVCRQMVVRRYMVPHLAFCLWSIRT